MRILLLTDVPPSTNFSGGLVLAQACKLLPRGSIACFCVLNPDLQRIDLDPELAGMPLEYVAKPRETGYRGSGPMVGLKSFLIERTRQIVATPELLTRASQFARRHKVDVIWAVLQGQTMIRLTGRLAHHLKLPLYTHVWDPLTWWLEANQVDNWHRKAALAEFDHVLRSSQACATASWAMSQEYERRYGIRSIPLISCHDRNWAQSPAPRLHDDSILVIGMAGQFYADVEWHTLVRCLNNVGWELAGRQVRMLVLGHYIPASDIPEGRCDFLGWHTQREAIRILAEQADVLFCPYPFAPQMAEVARLSFPSKLVSYLAAGRPVLFHGPRTSSPAHYIEDRHVGLVTAGSGEPHIFDALNELACNSTLYADLAMRAQQAFATDFTLESMRARLLEFLGVTATELEQTRPLEAFDPTAPAPRLPPPRPIMSKKKRLAYALVGIARRTPARPLVEALLSVARWCLRQSPRHLRS